MRYFVDLFSPDTAEIFSKSGKNVSGFRIKQKSYFEKHKIGVGDRFICYVTKIQRFIGVLEITSAPFVDDSLIFHTQNDPFILRLNVKPIVWLPLEQALPIHDPHIWEHLSFTRGLKPNSSSWTHKVLQSPLIWETSDGRFLEERLSEQEEKQVVHPLSEDDRRKMRITKIRISEKREVIVSIPEDETPTVRGGNITDTTDETRESLKIQAKLAEIGENLGFKIWLPRNDRSGVLKNWSPKKDGSLLSELPFAFDDVTLRTVENIDVLWVRGRTIARAFEVEGTTSIYSGILRMADLFSLLPNLEVKIHIVAPEERRNEVFKQILRPVFAVMERGPLSELCSYIPYGSVKKLASEGMLEHMKDTIIEKYSERPDEQDV